MEIPQFLFLLRFLCCTGNTQRKTESSRRGQRKKLLRKGKEYNYCQEIFFVSFLNFISFVFQTNCRCNVWHSQNSKCTHENTQSVQNETKREKKNKNNKSFEWKKIGKWKWEKEISDWKISHDRTHIMKLNNSIVSFYFFFVLLFLPVSFPLPLCFHFFFLYFVRIRQLIFTILCTQVLWHA